MDDLTDRRVLVVEDEILVAVLIEDALEYLGCIVVGPISRLDAALKAARESDFDAALLDVNIRGGQVFPVADLLLTRHIPFIFASGYGDWALPEHFQGGPRLQKPFTTEDLEAALRALPPPA